MIRLGRSGLCVPLVLTILVWAYNFIALKILYLEVSPPAAALGRHLIMYLVLVGICKWGFGLSPAKERRTTSDGTTSDAAPNNGTTSSAVEGDPSRIAHLEDPAAGKSKTGSASPQGTSPIVNPSQASSPIENPKSKIQNSNWLWGGWRVGLFGALSMGFYMVLFMEALANTSAPEGAIVIATAPLFTTLFAILAKQETFSPRVTLGALVAFSGVTLVVFGGGGTWQGHLLGNGLMLASAAAWALSSVVSRPLVKERPAILVLTQAMPAALVVLLPYALVDLVRTPWAELSWQSWLAFGHFTLLAGVLGFVGFFIGVQRIGAPGAMYYQFCVAPLATLFAWMFLGDALHPLQILGMGVVLTGVVLATVARGRAAQKEIMAFECPAEG